MDEQIARIEQWLRIWLKQDKDCSAIAEIPGVGLLTATAAVATMADPKAFKSGREFAAFIGLVPRQHGSGGKVSLFGISKRGDTYLRTLLIHGARSVMHAAERTQHTSAWLCGLLQRRNTNVVAVACEQERTDRMGAADSRP